MMVEFITYENEINVVNISFATRTLLQALNNLELGPLFRPNFNHILIFNQKKSFYVLGLSDLYYAFNKESIPDS